MSAHNFSATMLLYLLFLTVLSSAFAQKCCSPGQYAVTLGLLTASVDDMGSSAATYGTIASSNDGKNHRINEVLNLSVGNDTREYRILQLYSTGYEYIIENGICTKTPLGRPWTPSCIPSNATVVGQYSIGPKMDIAVTDYQYVIGNMTVITGVTAKCAAIMHKSYGKAPRGESVMTYMAFLGLTAGIRDPHVFDVPSICTKAQTVDPTSPRRRRSFHSQIYGT